MHVDVDLCVAGALEVVGRVLHQDGLAVALGDERRQPQLLDVLAQANRLEPVPPLGRERRVAAVKGLVHEFGEEPVGGSFWLVGGLGYTHKNGLTLSLSLCICIYL